MGIARDGVAVVIESAFVGVMGQVVFEELCFGGGVLAEGAFFARAIGGSGVAVTAAVATAEGAGEATLVLGVGVGIDGVVGVGRLGGGGVAGRLLVFLKDRFGGAEEGGSGVGWQRGVRCGRWSRVLRGLEGSEHRGDLFAAEGA